VIAAVTGQLKDYENQLFIAANSGCKRNPNIFASVQACENWTKSWAGIGIEGERAASQLRRYQYRSRKRYQVRQSNSSVKGGRSDKSGQNVSEETARTTAVTSSDSKEGDESFSACLLIMDDNHRLQAVDCYYFAMPLRNGW
jgi:hypothetical protein